MASARITCPDCKSVLRPAKPVPDGKKVKCPKCGNTFTTPGLVEEVLEVEEVQEAPRKKASAKKSSEKKSKAAIKKASSPKPPTKKTAYEEEEEESGGIYAFVESDRPKVEGEEDEEESRPEINYAPDMSIKDLRGPAQEAVVKPSNYMMLIGGLSALCNIFLICWSFWPMVFSDSVVDYYKVLKKHYTDAPGLTENQRKNALQKVEGYKEFKDLDEKDRDIVNEANEAAVSNFWVGGFPPLGRFWMMGGFIFVLIYNALAITGAVKMQNLESRRWGIASSIMMLFPMGCFGLSFLLYLGIDFLETMTGLLGELSVFYGLVLGAIPYFASIYVAVMSLRVLFNQAVIDGFEYIAD
jgi:predicted Zn finger-like uncharacterized protein